ncbi:MAG: hypothetical protein LUG64_02205 [Clostridiales bacterium]|nr:hypothetical protein [Clostridiales bacterium]
MDWTNLTPTQLLALGAQAAMCNKMAMDECEDCPIFDGEFDCDEKAVQNPVETLRLCGHTQHGVELREALCEIEGTELPALPGITLADLCKLVADRSCITDDDVEHARIEVFTDEGDFYTDVGGIISGAKNAELTILSTTQLCDKLTPLFAKARVRKVASSSKSSIAVLVEIVDEQSSCSENC